MQLTYWKRKSYVSTHALLLDFPGTNSTYSL
jgi:hypothetical protein